MSNIYSKVFSDANFVELFLAGKVEIETFLGVLDLSGFMFILIVYCFINMLFFVISAKLKFSKARKKSFNSFLMSSVLVSIIGVFTILYYNEFNLAKANKISVKSLSDADLLRFLQDAGTDASMSCLSLFKNGGNRKCNYKALSEAIVEYEKRVYKLKTDVGTN